MRRAGGLRIAMNRRGAVASLALEQFVTTASRQSFLVPPRRRRAFPLVEVA